MDVVSTVPGEVIQMKRLSVAIMLFLPALTISCGNSCQDPSGGGDSARALYFTSFETAADIEGWTGLAEENLTGEPAPAGGKRSLLVGGGCIQPTAYIVLASRETDAVYSLSCWGRLIDESQSGSVVLATDEDWDQRDECSVRVTSEDWTYYRSQDQVVCPAGQRLRIEIYIGGIVGASMSLDRLAVEEVE